MRLFRRTRFINVTVDKRAFIERENKNQFYIIGQVSSDDLYALYTIFFKESLFMSLKKGV